MARKCTDGEIWWGRKEKEESGSTKTVSSNRQFPAIRSKKGSKMKKDCARNETHILLSLSLSVSLSPRASILGSNNVAQLCNLHPKLSAKGVVPCDVCFSFSSFVISCIETKRRFTIIKSGACNNVCG